MVSYVLCPPQALEMLQFLSLADNLLDSIPGPLPLSLRSLHLQVRSLDQTKGRNGACAGGRQVASELRASVFSTPFQNISFLTVSVPPASLPLTPTSSHPTRPFTFLLPT